ncbi:chain-length determining protein [Brevundimonas diminuta]|jgi:capsular polysaccharide transport system permease protein|uniref:chain-length determining protein n=1 Tax=Brevundimonas diminuta TaxID=293 RepID=UPI003D9A46E2
MTESTLKYIKPLPRVKSAPPSMRERMKKWPWAFISIVVLPTLIAAIYFFLIATPRYVSEAHFIVRQPDNRQPTALGMVLQGAGLSSAQGDTFAVHEYMMSRDALRDINSNRLVSNALGYPAADPLSRRPSFWQDKSFEDLYKGFRKYLTVGYDSSTGISILRVEAFRAKDAQQINEALLAGGERLVNRLNARSTEDSVAQATRAVAEAQQRLLTAQQSLAAFRRQEQFIDPDASARENTALIASLSSTIATLRAEREQIAQSTPNNPQLPALDGRIQAYEKQLSDQRSKLTGGSASLAPKIGAYETLALDRQLAAQALSAATIALDSAKQDVRRQHLYLERVVTPNLPDKASQPRQLRMVLTVLLASLIIYALGWLLVAGVREHQQN